MTSYAWAQACLIYQLESFFSANEILQFLPFTHTHTLFLSLSPSSSFSLSTRALHSVIVIIYSIKIWVEMIILRKFDFEAIYSVYTEYSMFWISGKYKIWNILPFAGPYSLPLSLSLSFSPSLSHSILSLSHLLPLSLSPSSLSLTSFTTFFACWDSPISPPFFSFFWHNNWDFLVESESLKRTFSIAHWSLADHNHVRGLYFAHAFCSVFCPSSRSDIYNNIRPCNLHVLFEFKKINLLKCTILPLSHSNTIFFSKKCMCLINPFFLVFCVNRLSITWFNHKKASASCWSAFYLFVAFYQNMGPFHQHSMSSFYAYRSQKRNKDSQVVSLFVLLGSACTKAASKMLTFIEIWGQFHQHSMSNFYAHRSQMRNKDSQVVSLFCAFGICPRKSCL